MFDFIEKQRNYSPKSCHWGTLTRQSASINTQLIIALLSNVLATISKEPCKLRKRKVQPFLKFYLEMFLNSFFCSLTLLTVLITIFGASVTFAEQEKKKKLIINPHPTIANSFKKFYSVLVKITWER